jgi:inner membrane protein
MDTLTHALSGALLARATAPARPKPHDLGPGARTLTGFLAAAFPDIDFALRAVDTLDYLNWHQGVTHSLILLPLWAWLLAQLFSWFTRWRYRWQAFYGAAVLGIAIHIAGDAFTAYGPMLLAPLSAGRISLPFSFVVDHNYTAIVAGGLALALLRPRSRLIAPAALVLLGGYIALQGVLHHRAVQAGEAYAADRGPAGAQVHALPQPLTPFNWLIIVAEGEAYDVAQVNLWRTLPPAPSSPEAGWLRRIAAAYAPVSAANWQRYWRFGQTYSEQEIAREAWRQEAFARFRRFAMFPALDRIEQNGDRACARFFDLRFLLPAMPPSFRFEMCRDASGDWRLHRVRGAFWID